MRVINCHAHFHGPDEVEEKRSLWDSLGYEQICMSFENEEVLKLAQRYPDYIIPFYHLDLDEEGPDAVAAAKERGFRGLKLIGPKKPYSHESYFPIYERAQALDVPALIHTSPSREAGGSARRTSAPSTSSPLPATSRSSAWSARTSATSGPWRRSRR